MLLAIVLALAIGGGTAAAVTMVGGMGGGEVDTVYVDADDRYDDHDLDDDDDRDGDDLDGDDDQDAYDDCDGYRDEADGC